MNNLSVIDLETKMLAHPQVECPVIHRFGPGVYIREVSMPAGTIAIGHHQNLEHLNIFLKGRVVILDDGGPKELVAPMIFTSKPGRKIGYIKEDVVWLNVYSTDETNIEKLEEKFLTKSEEWQKTLNGMRSIKQLTSNIDREDFDMFIDEFKLSKELIKKQSEEKSDMVGLPFGDYKVTIGDSEIQGIGLFATAMIEPGEVIAPARIYNMRTIAGRYTNHSKNPNAMMVKSANGIDLVAKKNISGCHGGLNGEEITIDYRQSLSLTLQIRGDKCQQ